MAIHPRAWQRMLSGRKLDLLSPSPADIEASDIAHGLSFVARWNGQTTGEFPYSVAEHSLLVERIVCLLNADSPPEERLSALLHDAAEYVISDLISPVKNMIGKDYDRLEDRLLAAIRQRFGMPRMPPLEQLRTIKQADRISAWLEATQIAGFSREEADEIFERPSCLIAAAADIRLRPPGQVRAEFESRAFDLARQVNGERPPLEKSAG